MKDTLIIPSIDTPPRNIHRVNGLQVAVFSDGAIFFQVKDIAIGLGHCFIRQTKKGTVTYPNWSNIDDALRINEHIFNVDTKLRNKGLFVRDDVALRFIARSVDTARDEDWMLRRRSFKDDVFLPTLRQLQALVVQTNLLIKERRHA